MIRRALLALAVWLCLGASFAHAQAQIADGVYFLAGQFPPDRQPDGNTVLIAGPEGLLAIDTGRHATHSQAIVDFVAREQRPLLAIVNTHWHLDHIGGNARLRELNPLMQVFASAALDEALGSFLKDYRADLERAVRETQGDTAAWRTELALIDAADKLAPNRIVSTSFEMPMAGRRLRLNLAQAATAGDIWVEDIASRTVIVGDLVTLPVPFFDTACAERWEGTLNTIASTPFERLIPGHGAPMSKREFEIYRTAFTRLLRCSESQRTSVVCARDWRRDVGSLMSPRDVTRSGEMIDYYFKAVLRSPKRAELCDAR